MKAFQFRLEAALRLREMQFQSERTKLQQLLAEEQRLKQSLETVGNERLHASTYVQNLENPANRDFRALSAFLLGSATRANSLREQISKAALVVQEQRHRVRKAERNVRLLTKLREKKLREWVLDHDKKIEAAAQDSWMATHYPSREHTPPPKALPLRRSRTTADTPKIRQQTDEKKLTLFFQTVD
jgi:flagellar biosynthesis chaperone FliJ